MYGPYTIKNTKFGLKQKKLKMLKTFWLLTSSFEYDWLAGSTVRLQVPVTLSRRSSLSLELFRVEITPSTTGIRGI